MWLDIPLTRTLSRPQAWSVHPPHASCHFSTEPDTCSTSYMALFPSANEPMKQNSRKKEALLRANMKALCRCRHATDPTQGSDKERGRLPVKTRVHTHTLHVSMCSVLTHAARKITHRLFIFLTNHKRHAQQVERSTLCIVFVRPCSPLLRKQPLRENCRNRNCVTAEI